MKIKFQADEDLHQDLVRAVRQHNSEIDFKTSHESNLRGALDPEVLDFAAREGRVLVSHDLRTMREHFAQFINTKTCAGVILIPQKIVFQRELFNQAVDELILIWEASEAEEYLNRILIIPM
jgi:predicted nuclease of predicted toxin-antitoxin system